jgi:DNA helicase II / ATP-dependent DNA helicase PcrA
MSDLLANLNSPQLQAVTLPPQHALILAGAGSGKTRVLTTRIAWLMSTGQVGRTGRPGGDLHQQGGQGNARAPVGDAADQHPRHVDRHLPRPVQPLLRAHYREAGLPQTFQILDSADQLAAVKRLLKNLNVDDEKYPPRELCHFINAHKEQGVARRRPRPTTTTRSQRVELYAEYENQCQREGVVDFAELLLRCYELLQRNEPLRRHYQERFRHILVDEFQDTNRCSTLAAAAGRGRRQGLFCVGDDDQSIYAFRGAEVGNMRDFEREFAGAQRHPLEQNYRSHGNILDAANALIKNNRERLGKNLWTDAGAGEPIRVFEALFRSRRGALRRRGNPRTGARRRLADADRLLYRSNAQSRVLEHELFTKPACRTRSMAACASSSARKSSMRWPICACSATRTTTRPSCASSISRRAASAPAR